MLGERFRKRKRESYIEMFSTWIRDVRQKHVSEDKKTQKVKKKTNKNNNEEPKESLDNLVGELFFLIYIAVSRSVA